VAVLERQQGGFERREIGEVAWRQDRALEHGEIDLDLIRPARV
jgi:hypothetical protein